MAIYIYGSYIYVWHIYMDHIYIYMDLNSICAYIPIRWATCKKKINLKKINTNGNDIQTCEAENITNELRGKCLKQ